MERSRYQIDLPREAPAYASALRTFRQHRKNLLHTRVGILASIVVLGAWLLLPVLLGIIWASAAYAMLSVQVVLLGVFLALGIDRAIPEASHGEQFKMGGSTAVLLFILTGGAAAVCVMVGFGRHLLELKKSDHTTRDPRLAFIHFGMAIDLYNQLWELSREQETVITTLVHAGQGDRYHALLVHHILVRESLLQLLERMFYLRPLGRPGEWEACFQVMQETHEAIQAFDVTFRRMMYERERLIASTRTP